MTVGRPSTLQRQHTLVGWLAAAVSAAAGANAAAAQQQQQRPRNCSSQKKPRINWDLTFRPAQLNKSFWSEQASKYTRRDVQVAFFFLVLITLLTVKQIQHTSWAHSVWTFAPAWTTQVLWMLALRNPAFYVKHRLPLLLMVKLKMAVQTLHANNSIIDLLYVDRRLARYGPPRATLLYKTVLVTGVAHFPAMTVCLPLPFWLQLGWMMFLSSSLFLSASPREMVTVTSVHDQLETLDTSNAFYARLVQSGAPVLIHPDPILEDRSAAMTVAMLTIYMSAAVATMYLAYVGQWIEMRGWLRDKAGSLAPTAGRQPSPAHPVEIDGVVLTRQQLLDMRRSPTAALLLDDGQGVLGRASAFCFHACIVNVLCMACLLLSQVLVLRVAPRLLPESVFKQYYPLRPEVAGVMCGLDDQPQFTGWVGKLLMVLAL